jgi:hypothetical protein
MYRWQVLLRKENQSSSYDMADVRNSQLLWHSSAFADAETWAYGPNAGGPVPADGWPASAKGVFMFAPPTEKDAADWRRAVMALRSVARRIAGYRKGKGLDRPELDARDADAVMEAYVSRMSPRIQRGDKPMRAPPPVRLVPNAPEKFATFADAAGVYFQVIFGSLHPEFSDPVCPDCERTLPPTKTGRQSRASRCRNCTKKRSWLNLKPEVRRKRMRDKKRNQRAKEKGA